MALKLIGAGFGRTGTMSLKGALEMIGWGPCYHMIEVIKLEGAPEHWSRVTAGEAVDWEEVFKGFVSTVDWPACNFYAELAEAYPEAKVLLSLRDPEKWWDSVHNTIYQALTADHANSPPNMQKQMAMANRLILEQTFGGKFLDRDHAIGVFNAHNEAVKAAFPPERLLVFDVKEGWEPLCAFLGADVPDEPFPRVNSTEDFRASFGGRQAESA